jgi:flagellar biosynthesis GTPase FlhF
MYTIYKPPTVADILLQAAVRDVDLTVARLAIAAGADVLVDDADGRSAMAAAACTWPLPELIELVGAVRRHHTERGSGTGTVAATRPPFVSLTVVDSREEASDEEEEESEEEASEEESEEASEEASEEESEEASEEESEESEESEEASEEASEEESEEESEEASEEEESEEEESEENEDGSNSAECVRYDGIVSHKRPRDATRNAGNAQKKFRS